ncbi:helix-turn-helix transcriptional regulator [Erysipelatoclostridium ramosum]|nr:helix-turn-helix transcriptional regulator [Thomasclavelia ramosa]
MVQQRLGCSMKTIQKIQRINQAVNLLKQQSLSLTAIAQQCGFYDQAHFIHDFREICNVTPQQYQKQLQD